LQLLKNIFEFISKYFAPILGNNLKLALMGISNLVATLITGFSQLIGFLTQAYNQMSRIVNLVNENKGLFLGQLGIVGSVIGAFGGGKAKGGPVAGGTSYLVGERGPELFTPNTSGMITPNNRLSGSGANVFNITVNGAIDAEGTARTIVDILNRSAARGGGGYNALVSV
jgi:hypothetical protein